MSAPSRRSCGGRALLWVLVAAVVAVGGALLLQANRRAEQVARTAQEQAAEQARQKAAQAAEQEMQARQQAQAEQSRVEQAYRAADDLLQRWDDANALAAAAPRMALADRVSALQALVREADALVLPACMDPHRPALIKGLRGVVDGYLAFLQDVNLGRLVAQAAMDDGRSALQAFRLELSSCRAAVARP